MKDVPRNTTIVLLGVMVLKVSVYDLWRVFDLATEEKLNEASHGEIIDRRY